jgi:hypothetical protein
VDAKCVRAAHLPRIASILTRLQFHPFKRTSRRPVPPGRERLHGHIADEHAAICRRRGGRHSGRPLERRYRTTHGRDHFCLRAGRGDRVQMAAQRGEFIKAAIGVRSWLPRAICRRTSSVLRRNSLRERVACASVRSAGAPGAQSPRAQRKLSKLPPGTRFISAANNKENNNAH